MPRNKQLPNNSSKMPPATALHDASSASSAIPSVTKQPQSAGSSIDTGSAGFIAPLAIFTGILVLLMLSFFYQVIKIYRDPINETLPTNLSASAVAAFQENRARARAVRKDEIGREVDAEPFSKWRAKQLERMKNSAAFPSQVVCVVCLSEFNDEDLIRDLACRHPYHINCLDEWYSRGHNRCPMCKSELCDVHSPKASEECPQGS